MATYTNKKAQDAGKHGMFRSSRLKATEVGRLYDVIVRDESSNEIAVDNGVAIKVGDPTGNGLQTRYATVAAIGDKVAIVGSPALVKDASTQAQAAEYNFYHKPGVVAKAYEVKEDEGDIFGVAQYQFTTVVAGEGKDVVVGNLVVVDGNGGYKELVSSTEALTLNTYGFIGKVYGFEKGDNETLVLVEVIKNTKVSE